MKATKAQLIAARKFWMPKAPEMKTPCVSCPFLKGNDEAWQEKLEALADHPLSPGEAKIGREMVRSEVRTRGDFMCHQTAYDADMKLKPTSEHRQCAGAAKFYREAK